MTILKVNHTIAENINTGISNTESESFFEYFEVMKYGCVGSIYHHWICLITSKY